MKEYFRLQYKILIRRLGEIGYSPILIGIFAILVFIGVSFYLFYKTDYAAYLYAFASISYTLKLSEQRRNDFLKSIFVNSTYKKVRLLENFILAFPFLVFLIFQEAFVVSGVLFFLSVIAAFFNSANSFNYTIPTPFGKKPFEFPVGFRKTFFIFPLAYFLTYQSISVDNFNLGIFSFLIIALLVISYYSKPENEYYVWIYKHSSKAFLLHKIKTSLLFFTLLCLPILFTLSYFYPTEIIILIAFLVLSYLYIVAMILAKYSSFPNEISLPQGVIFMISFMFPPLLLAIIPHFYSQAIKQLKPILQNDKN